MGLIDKNPVERRRERFRGRNSRREHHQIEDRQFTLQISPLNGRLISSPSQSNGTSNLNTSQPQKSTPTKTNEENTKVSPLNKGNSQSTTSNASHISQISLPSLASPPRTQEYEDSMVNDDSKYRTSTSSKFNPSTSSIIQIDELSMQSNRSNQSFMSPSSQDRTKTHNLSTHQQNNPNHPSPLKIQSSTSPQDDISSSPPMSSPLPPVSNSPIKAKYIDSSEQDKSIPKFQASASLKPNVQTTSTTLKTTTKIKPPITKNTKLTAATPKTNVSSKVATGKSKENSKRQTPRTKTRKIHCYKLSKLAIVEDEADVFSGMATPRASQSKVNPFDIAMHQLNKSTKHFENDLTIDMIPHLQNYHNTLNTILINFSDTWDTQISLQQKIKFLEKSNTTLKDELLDLKKQSVELNGKLCQVKREYSRDEEMREKLESCHHMTTELQSLSQLCLDESDTDDVKADINKWFTLQSNLYRLRSRLGLNSISSQSKDDESNNLEDCMDLFNRLKLVNNQLKSKLSLD